METKKEYIEVSTLLTTLEETSGDMFDDLDGDYYAESGFSRNALEELITTMPKADAVEVVHGRWINKTKDINGMVEERNDCSACGQTYWFACPDFYYCPNCGAIMDLEEA